ncbi:MAG: mechanosensitive ion channel, partial [Bacteroidetes bacterium]|nr:mechanosensitive ion channel [Bacteroidota bacterium]
MTYPLMNLGDNSVTLGMVITVLSASIILYIVSGWIKHFLVEKFLHHRGLDVGVSQAIASLVRYVILFFGFMIIIQWTGIDLTALNVFAGAIGIGIGLGLQSIANNFISGLIILFGRPIKIGDRIEVGSIIGDVLAISPRASTILTNDNIAIIVPNSEFINSTVTNWSYTDRRIRFNVPVGVAYHSDPEAVRSLLINVALKHPGVLKEPAPDALLVEFGDSSLNFQLRVWTFEYINKPYILRSELNYEILKELRAQGIEIPFPQRDI